MLKMFWICMRYEEIAELNQELLDSRHLFELLLPTFENLFPGQAAFKKIYPYHFV